MLASPDLRFQLHGARVKARSDGTGAVSFSFRLSGLYFIPEEAYNKACRVASDEDSIVASSTNSSEDESQSSISIPPSGVHSIAQLQPRTIASSVLLLEIDCVIYDRAMSNIENGTSLCDRGPYRPVLYEFDGIASMHLDANNMIYYMDFQGY